MQECSASVRSLLAAEFDGSDVLSLRKKLIGTLVLTAVSKAFVE